MLDLDIVIIGAGPAGAATAVNLAPFWRVMLVERRAGIAPRIGESLVPAARRLLADMGLLKSFLAEKHEPWYFNRFVWGGPDPQDRDFMRDPDSHGWHLDRPRFEQWLRDAAKERGAHLLSPARVIGLDHDGERWNVLLNTKTSSMAVTARLIIDAGGRASNIASKFGYCPQVHSNLVCCWLYGRDDGEGGRGLTYVEAVKDGWWYTAPIPKGRRVLAFHTDADLPFARLALKRNGLIERLGETKELSRLLTSAGFVPDAEGSITSAKGAVLEPAAGKAWLAVGDAALSFDPLSSQGLFNALFSGLMAAEAANGYLEGKNLSFAEYRQTMRRVAAAYRRNLASCYSAEQRWPEAAFWRRRHEY